jgi:hypothetical protein
VYGIAFMRKRKQEGILQPQQIYFETKKCGERAKMLMSPVAFLEFHSNLKGHIPVRANPNQPPIFDFPTLAGPN